MCAEVNLGWQRVVFTRCERAGTACWPCTVDAAAAAAAASSSAAPITTRALPHLCPNYDSTRALPLMLHRLAAWRCTRGRWPRWLRGRARRWWPRCPHTSTRSQAGVGVEVGVWVVRYGLGGLCVWASCGASTSCHLHVPEGTLLRSREPSAAQRPLCVCASPQ